MAHCTVCKCDRETTRDAWGDIVCVVCRQPIFPPKRQLYCPDCKCPVFTKENEWGDQACVSCGRPLCTPEHGQLYPDGTPFVVNDKGIGAMGWICPVCGAGVSPLVNTCPCRGERIVLEFPGDTQHEGACILNVRLDGSLIGVILTENDKLVLGRDDGD